MKINKKTIAIIGSVVFTFILLFTYVNFNKETPIVGKILSITGLVEVKKAGNDKMTKVFANMAFTQGDTILTGSDGLAELMLDEDK